MIARNTGAQVAGELASKVALVALFAVMARELGPADFGALTFGLSITLLLVSLGGYAADDILTRAVARDRQAAVQHLLWTNLALKTGVGVATIAGTAALAVLGDYDRNFRLALLILGLNAFLELLAPTFYAVFQGLDDLVTEAKGLALQRLVRALVGIAVLLAGGGVIAVAAVYVLGAALALAYVWRVLRRRSLWPPFRLSRDTGRWLTVAALPIALAGVFNAVAFRINVVLLSALAGNEAVGAYGAASRAVESLLFLGFTFVAATMPLLSRVGPDTTPSLASVFEGAVKVITAGLLPVGTALVLFAEPLSRTLYGSEFANAAAAVRWLGMTVFLFSLSQLAAYTLIAQDRQRAIAWISAAVSVQNVALNLVVIPAHSFRGAAATALVSAVIYTASCMVAALRLTGPISLRRVALGPGVALIAMVATTVAAGTAVVGGGLALLAYLVTVAVVERVAYPADLRRGIAVISRWRRAV